jgi:inner membrane protein
MASALTHAVVALALGKSYPHPVMTWRIVFLGMACSIMPDLDVIGFAFGIQYGDLWGHRGMTHSLFFAALFSAALVSLWFRQRPWVVQMGLFFYLFLCTISHGVLDAVTNGGLGVAFLSPFDHNRYFFGLRPVLVSPIGIDQFFNEYGLHVLASEVLWIWMPSLALSLMVRFIAIFLLPIQTHKKIPHHR